MSDGSGPVEDRAADADRPSLSRHLDRPLSGLGLDTPFARDCLLAVLVALLSAVVLLTVLGPVADQASPDFTRADLWTVLALVMVQSLALCLRRVRTVACMLVITLAQLAIVAVLPDGMFVRFLAAPVAIYTAGTLLRPGVLARWLGVVLALEGAGGVLVAQWLRPVVRPQVLGEPSSSDPLTSSRIGEWALTALIVVLVYVAAALYGLVVATRRDRMELLEARAAAAVREQQAGAQRAVHAERIRMARELHDIAAHHLSGLVVQAAAAERLIDGNAESAKQAVRSIRAQGKEALANLRTVVGVLRESDAPTGAGADGDAPVPGLAEVGRLVQAARELDVDVDLATVGDRYALPPIADVTAYRVLQEALANARQHAPGALVSVRIRYGDDGLDLEVENPVVAPRPGGVRDEPRGYGLLGMHERSELTGATLTAGPTPAGTWRVLLALPYGRPRRAPAAVEEGVR